MYCVKCGVELSEGQTVCPICDTRVYHPDFDVTEKNTYPKIPFKSEEFNRKGLIFVITVLFLIPLLLPVFLELSWHGAIGWSGYTAGGVLLLYIVSVLPAWFKHPNPVIFIPCGFAAGAVYLWYISFATGGGWFLPFALPLIGAITLIITAVVAVLRYVGRGKLYVFGGGLIALGFFCALLETLIAGAFGVKTEFIWSLAPLTILFILGMLLIIIAIVKPFRESLRKIFFVGEVDK